MKVQPIIMENWKQEILLWSIIVIIQFILFNSGIYTLLLEFLTTPHRGI